MKTRKILTGCLAFLLVFLMPDNDVIRIPETYEAEVTSDESEDATQIVTLDRLAVEYEIAGYSAAGRPNDYTATVTYRGIESYLDPHHVLVTATYGGVLSANVSQYKLEATYQKETLPVATPAPTTITQTPVPLAPVDTPTQAPFVWWPYALAALAAAAGASLIVFFWLRRQFRVCQADQAGKLKTVMRLRLRADKGGLIVSIPTSINLSNIEGEHVGVVAGIYARQCAHITIYQDDKAIYDGEVISRIPLYNEYVWSAYLKEHTEYLREGAGA